MRATGHEARLGGGYRHRQGHRFIGEWWEGLHGTHTHRGVAVVGIHRDGIGSVDGGERRRGEGRVEAGGSSGVGRVDGGRRRGEGRVEGVGRIDGGRRRGEGRVEAGGSGGVGMVDGGCGVGRVDSGCGVGRVDGGSGVGRVEGGGRRREEGVLWWRDGGWRWWREAVQGWYGRSNGRCDLV